MGKFKSFTAPYNGIINCRMYSVEMWNEIIIIIIIKLQEAVINSMQIPNQAEVYLAEVD